MTIGDLEDFEQLAVGSDLLIGNSNVNAIAKRLSIPLYRLGIPIYDRLGNGQFTKVGYRGTMELLFGIGNLFLEARRVIDESSHSHSYCTLSENDSTVAIHAPTIHTDQSNN